MAHLNIQMWLGIACAFAPVLLHSLKLLDESLQTDPKIQQKKRILQI